MGFERIAEQRIREAVERGDFERLPGSGARIDLEDYFATPEEVRMAYSILKNANCTPPEVELLNEIARLERAAADAADSALRRSLQRTLADRRTELALRLERRTRR